MSSINYDLKKIHAIAFDVDGVLSPSTIPLAPDGVPMRMVNIKDGYALQLAMKHGYKIAIISGADTPAVRVRFAGLGITDLFMGASVKLPVLQKWMADNTLTPDEVAFVGDDIPDYEAMQAVGLSVAPADAAVEIREIAIYVSPFEGGRGVGRDVIEQVMRAHGDWLADNRAFGW